VGGAPGIGKTSLVAALASEAADSSSIFWYKFRPGMNAGLTSILFDLGEYGTSENFFDLADYMDGALPSPDMGLATRLALRALDGRRRLLVFDDYHVAEENEPVLGFLEEIAARLPLVRVITVGRRRLLAAPEMTTVEIAPFTRTESMALLARLKVSCSPQTARRLHTWTGGNPQLLKLAASWLKTATEEEVARGFSSLTDQLEVQTFLLSNVTELLDSDDRALLQAASVFRDRFSDEALSFVAQRTRGAVIDASIRLVRVYVATRSLDGEGAFFHASVRDYVYERLDPPRRTLLHTRAALWYERVGDEREADYHRRRAQQDP
jgi:ATP/maltotriose-dependent transcriptional regulator MalT